MKCVKNRLFYTSWQNGYIRIMCFHVFRSVIFRFTATDVLSWQNTNSMPVLSPQFYKSSEKTRNTKHQHKMKCSNNRKISTIHTFDYQYTVNFRWIIVCQHSRIDRTKKCVIWQWQRKSFTNCLWWFVEIALWPLLSERICCCDR